MDTKKLRQNELENIKYRFTTMRNRAEAVVQAARELAECLENIEHYAEYAEEAKEERDFAEAAKHEKYLTEEEAQLKVLQEKLDLELYGVCLDFFVKDADDLL